MFVRSKLLTGFDQKLKINLSKGIESQPEGCRLLLVIPYFEFLTVSDFKIANSLPRLHLWPANLIKSFISLDTNFETSSQFGRLPLKHISCTPFNDTESFYSYKLPDEIQKHIDDKFPHIAQTQDKLILQINTQKFFQGLVRNHTPTLMSYIDNIVSVFPSTSTATPTNYELENFLLPVPELPRLQDNETFTGTKQFFDDIIQNFSKIIDIRDPELEFEFPATTRPSYEELALADFCPQPTLQEPETTPSIIDVMQGFLRELQSVKIKRSSHETKFSLPLFRFLKPGEILQGFLSPSPFVFFLISIFITFFPRNYFLISMHTFFSCMSNPPYNRLCQQSSQ